MKGISNLSNASSVANQGGYHLEMKGISNTVVVGTLGIAGGYHLEMKGISNSSRLMIQGSQVVIILK